MANRPCEDADAAADQLADIDDPVGPCRQFDLDLGPLRVGTRFALSPVARIRVTIRRRDDAVVLHAWCNQCNKPPEPERSVPWLTMLPAPACEETPCARPGNRQRTNRSVMRPDRRRRPARWDQRNTARIEQEDAPVRLQAAKDRTGIASRDTVENLARGAGLDEAGNLAGTDRERPPVDHGTVAVGNRQVLPWVWKAALPAMTVGQAGSPAASEVSPAAAAMARCFISQARCLYLACRPGGSKPGYELYAG